MSKIAKGLLEPFASDKIHWRVGAKTKDNSKGLALAYVDARDVMARLDDVCEVQGWQNRYTIIDGRTICEIGIKFGDEWIWKSDGAGDTDVEAEKGALSDAFKRAAVRWGIGRHLYDMEASWVQIEPRGRSYVIKESELKRLGNSPQQIPQDVGPSEESIAYTNLALEAIKETLNSRGAANLWWTGEKEHMRKAGVSKDQQQVLLQAIRDKFPEKETA